MIRNWYTRYEYSRDIGLALVTGVVIGLCTGIALCFFK